MMMFDKAGGHNTDEAIEMAFEGVAAHSVTHVVVASTAGDTGVKAARRFSGTDVQVVVIAHNTGFGKEGQWEFDPEKKKEIEELGGIVYHGTMVLRGLGAAIKKKSGNYSHEELVANTLRMFGQGMKVCVEMAAMAADAGLVPFGDIICVAGTARGADTCALIRANSSNRFFDIKVKRVLAKPENF